MERKYLQDLLAEFGKTLGIEELALDEEDGCVIGFDDSVVVSLQYVEDTNSLVLFSNLGTVNDADPSGLFAEMLEANFYERARGGCSVGYQRDSKTAWTISDIPVAVLKPHTLEDALERFVNVSEAWKKRLTEVTGAVSSEPTQEPSMPPGIRV